MSKIIAVALTLMLGIVTEGADAGQITDLYQAEVVAQGSTEQWQQLALSQVLTRVSGKADLTTNPQIAAELKRASGYIKQFESVRHSEGNRMRALLDAVKVNQLLQQNNIAVWGAMRPDILVWLVHQDGAERTFVRSSELPLNSALRQAFRFGGLPLLQPLYDMDDVLLLSETDVWAGFWQQIEQASNRYSADIVIAATVDNISQNGSTQLRLTWQRQAEGKTLRDEVIAADETNLMQAFASVLAAQLAEQYASIISAEGGGSMVLKVQQLQSLSDIVQVQRLLQQLVGVSEVTIGQFDGGTAYYKLQSSISADGIMNALRFNTLLRLQSQDAEMASSAQDALDATAPLVLATFVYSRP